MRCNPSSRLHARRRHRSIHAAIEAMERRVLLSGAPNGPYALTATPIANGIQINFYDSAEDETGFTVERGDAAGGPFTPILTIGPSSGRSQSVTTFDTNVVAGHTYFYRVFAVNGPYTSSITGPAAASLSGTTNPGGPPNGPYALTATVTSPSAVQLQFYDSATNETGFALERSLSYAGPFTRIATLAPSAGGGAAVNYTDNTVQPGNTYYYRVYAENGPAISGFTDLVLAPVPGSPTGGVINPGGAPNGPYALTASATAADQPQLQFYDSADNETGFIVERSLSPGGPYTPAATLGPSAGRGQAVGYTDTNVTLRSDTYYYRVYAINGPYVSSIAGPTPVAGPGAPNGGTNSPISPSGLTVSLGSSNQPLVQFFDGSTNETGFVLERGDSFFGPFTQLASFGPLAGTGLPINFTDTSAQPGHTYYYRAYSVNGPYRSGIQGPVSVTIPIGQTGPFGGTPVQISATAPTLIEAENFDLGGQDVAYHDTTLQNEGGAYRPNEGVDIVSNADATNGFAVVSTHPGEWLDYTVNVAATGYYQLGLRTASLNAGGLIHLEVDRQPTGQLTAPDTGNAQSFQRDVTSQPFYITARTHVLRLAFDTAQQASGLTTNVDNLTLTPVRTDGKRYEVTAGGSNLGAPFKISRFNADGTPDATFTTVTLAPPPFANIAPAVLPQADGTIVVVIEDHGADNLWDLRLVRISDTGQILKLVTTPTYTNTNGGPLLRFGAVAPDGKLILAGQQVDPAGQFSPMLVERYNADLTPDTTFGNGGSVQISSLQQLPYGFYAPELTGVNGLENRGVQVQYTDSQGVVRPLNLDASGNVVAPIPAAA